MYWFRMKLWHSLVLSSAQCVDFLVRDVLILMNMVSSLRFVQACWFSNFAVPRYADAETLQPSIHLSEDDIKHRINAQRRMCAYRSVIFWTYPDIRRRQRKPIPSCVYLMIRSMYPNVDNEEIWADLEHTIYVDVPEEDWPVSYYAINSSIALHSNR